MNTLDDDYGIVYYKRNSKHHRRKCQQVHTEANQFQYKESSHQRHRNGNGRNQCRAHILQEDIHHDKHQNKRFNQGFDYFMNRGKQKVISILGYIDV